MRYLCFFHHLLFAMREPGMDSGIPTNACAWQARQLSGSSVLTARADPPSLQSLLQIRSHHVSFSVDGLAESYFGAKPASRCQRVAHSVLNPRKQTLTLQEPNP